MHVHCIIHVIVCYYIQNATFSSKVLYLLFCPIKTTNLSIKRITFAVIPHKHKCCLDKRIEDSCQNLNISCCFVTCKFRRLAVVPIYRSPSTCPRACLQELCTLLDKLFSCVKNVILAGDFNIDLHNGSSITNRYVSLLSD